VHPGCASEEVGIDDPANRFAYLAILAWPTGTALPGEASPAGGEALSMPAQNGFGLDEKKSLLPVAPDPGQYHPEDTIQFPNPEPRSVPTENRELLRECEVLESQIRTLREGGRYQRKQPQNGQDHGRKCRVA